MSFPSTEFPAATTPSRPATRWWFPALLLLAGVLAYSNVWHTPFVLDDQASVVDNASIRRLWPPGDVLSPPAGAGVGGRPLANLSFALNFAAGGLAVEGYHVVNVALHLVSALLLFGLVRRTLQLPAWSGRFPPATADRLGFATAFLWVLHPLHTEAVTYISQRTEILMGFFYLLAFYCFTRGAQEHPRRWFAATVLACLAGMATKEVMVTAPVMLLLYDRTFVGGSFRAAWAERKKLHLACAASWALLLFLLVDVQERGVGYAAVTWWEYALTSCRAIALYLRLALWPAPLVFDYGTDVARSPLEVWPQALALTALAAATAWALWRSPRAGFLGAWLFVLLAPASSVVPVAGQPVAEHRMYLPLAALAAGAALLAHRRLGARTLVALVPLGGLLLGATYSRNRDFRDDLALWTDTVAKRPANARAHAALGAAHLARGQHAPAIAALERALQLDPASAEAHNNLATALTDVNRTADALAHFTAALRLRPGTASTHYNFGNALLSLGRAAEAIAQQQQALLLQPDFPEAHCGLGNARLAAGRVDEAIGSFRAALQLRPGLVPAHYGLATALGQAGRPAESIPHYEATLRAVPASVETHYNLGNVFLALDRPADAAARYARAVELKPDFAEAHHNLATALARLGRTPEAIAHYEIALRLRPDFSVTRTALEALRAAR